MQVRVCGNEKCAKEFEPNTTFQKFCKTNCRIAVFLRSRRRAKKEATA